MSLYLAQCPTDSIKDTGDYTFVIIMVLMRISWNENEEN
jgi:hypothetical protein